MEINRKELRQTARKQLKGNWLWVIGLLIIPGIVNLFLEYVTNYVWTGSFNTNNLSLVSWWQGLGWSIFTIITALIATRLPGEFNIQRWLLEIQVKNRIFLKQFFLVLLMAIFLKHSLLAY